MITVTFINHQGNGDFMIERYDDHLTRGVMKNIFNQMFMEVCDKGIDARHLTALIDTGVTRYYVDAVTYQSGSQVYTNFCIKGQIIRQMFVAK